jgi:MFS family permease
MFGLKQFGSIMALTHTAIIIPVLIGPIMAGLIFDLTDGYNLMFAITIGLLIISILSFLMAKGSNPNPSVLSGALDLGATGAIGYLH